MFVKASSLCLLLITVFHSSNASPLLPCQIVNCLLNPCQFATCPAFGGATCVADYCGGCNARWYFNGQEVTDQCGTIDTDHLCSDGSYAVNCFANPCLFESCDVEGAICQGDYCGGCNARWYLDGQDISHKCGILQ